MLARRSPIKSHFGRGVAELALHTGRVDHRLMKQARRTANGRKDLAALPSGRSPRPSAAKAASDQPSEMPVVEPVEPEVTVLMHAPHDITRVGASK